MTSKLFPPNPSEVMVIRQISPEITTLSLPFARFGWFHLGARSTIVRLATGSLAVFSPVPLTSEVQKLISTQGKLKYIAAPDLQHHLNITPWKRAFPHAEVIAPEGLWEKRQANSEFKDTEFRHIFRSETKQTLTVSEEFDSEFEVEYVDGHSSRELVFLHKPTRTVIEADLLFNLPANEQYSRTTRSPTSGIINKLLISLISTQPPALGHKIIAWYLLSAQNRNEFTKSIVRIDQWDFDRLIPCHGDVIETGAKGVFRTVFEWFLDGKQKRT